MPEYKEIRAIYDNSTIIVYQAYNKTIATSAVENNKFVEPFNFNRMTWIKPSFLWMMERSGWGQKPDQEHILAIKIKRKSFEFALNNSVLSSPDKKVYTSAEEWKERLKKAKIRIQWDPERNINGGKLEYRSIQIGISHYFVNDYNNDWIVEIRDITNLAKEIKALLKNGEKEKAISLLPIEEVYPLPNDIKKILGM